jgi:hypothetical protein
VAEAARVKELAAVEDSVVEADRVGQAAVEDLAVDPDRAVQEVADQGAVVQVVEDPVEEVGDRAEDLGEDLDRVGQGAVEDLAEDPDLADRAAADQEVVVQVVEDPVEGAEDRAEDLAEVQVGLAEAVGELGRVENQGSGAQLRRCCATRWREELRAQEEWDPQGWVEEAAAAEPTR